MSIASVSPKGMKALREHGHADFWEVAIYGNSESVTVECTKCGEVLIELVNQNSEERRPVPVFINAHELMDQLRDCLSTLPEREKQMVVARVSGKTWKECGALIGRSAERARQLGTRGRRRLNHPSRSKKLQQAVRVGEEG